MFKVIALLGFYVLMMLAIGLGSPAVAENQISQTPTAPSDVIVAQCNELITVANRATDSVQRISADPTIDSLSGLMAIISVADQAITGMQALTLSDGTVLGFRDRFVAMYTGTRQAGQALIDAANQNNQTAAEKAFQDLQDATAVEGDLVAEVNRYCGYTATSEVRSDLHSRF